VGRQDGGIAAHNAFTEAKLRRVDHRVIPRTIFTDPQIATVGMTEGEAIAAGHDCWCNTVPMSLVPRAGAIRYTEGMIKMVANDETEEVLGVSMVGNSAGEVIHEAAMGLRFRAKIFRLHRPAARLPDDGGGAEDCCNLTPQRSRKTLLLRRVMLPAVGAEPSQGKSRRSGSWLAFGSKIQYYGNYR
jgi:hypothetical protein